MTIARATSRGGDAQRWNDREHESGGVAEAADDRHLDHGAEEEGPDEPDGEAEPVRPPPEHDEADGEGDGRRAEVGLGEAMKRLAR